MTLSKLSLSTAIGLALLDGALVGAAGEVAEDEDLEGELDVLLGALGGRAIGDVDALLGGDRTRHDFSWWIGVWAGGSRCPGSTA
jgi:hypothetical protein